MSYTKKPFEELNLIDDYLMNAVTGDPEVGEPFCHRLLSVLLQRKIGKIHVTAQKVVLPRTPDTRGIRMDVEVIEAWEEQTVHLEKNIYDLEPHRKPATYVEETWRKKDRLPRKNRFCQAKIDSRHMKSGDADFGNLPDLYVINILDYDPFGMGQMQYTIQNECEEEPDLEYDDGLQFLYFNINGSKFKGSQGVKNVLDFIRNSDEAHAVDDATRELYQYIKRVKTDPKVRDAYMTLGEYIDREVEEAVYETLKDAQEKAAKQLEEVEEKAAKQLEEAEEKAARQLEKTALKTVQDNILELLEEVGVIPDEIRLKVRTEGDMAALKRWLKLAAHSESIKEFNDQI